MAEKKKTTKKKTKTIGEGPHVKIVKDENGTIKYLPK